MKLLRIRWWFIVLVGFLLIAFGGPIYLLTTGNFMGKHWSRAETGSANIAPDPSIVQEAVVQVYAARTWGARGAVAVHTWISVKPEHSDSYTVYQKVGWRLRHAGTAIVIREDVPDRYWYGNRPWLLADIRGEVAKHAIETVHEAALSYPYPREYRLWPGPNSNTFTAWIARHVPELRADLPPTAIGKDWLGGFKLFARSPSGTGFQFTLLGALGFTLGLEEGLELNIGCIHFGLDPFDMAIRLPGFGNISLFPRKYEDTQTGQRTDQGA